MYAFHEQLFFYTNKEIYRCDVHGRNWTLVLTMDKAMINSTLCVVEHDAEKIVFATEGFFGTIYLYASDGRTTDPVKPFRVVEVSPDFHLIGSHKGLLYFVTISPNGTWFYVAWREDVEVKRRCLGDGFIVTHDIVINGLFSCFMDIDSKKYLLVVDLNSDTVVFKQPTEVLRFRYREDIFPVIGKLPTSLVWKQQESSDNPE